jgi:hypothetical protein
MPSDDADRETIAAPRMSQSVSSFVVNRITRLTAAIITVIASVRASRSRGIAAASRRPALVVISQLIVCSLPEEEQGYSIESRF